MARPDGTMQTVELDSVHHGEWTMVRKNGSRFAAALTVTPVREGNLRVVGRVGLIEDISLRKQQEMRLKGLVDALPDMVFQLSSDGVFMGRRSVVHLR